MRKLRPGVARAWRRIQFYQKVNQAFAKALACVHRELLRGDAVSKAAARKAGVGGSVRDAEFPAGDGKFRGSAENVRTDGKIG